MANQPELTDDDVRRARLSAQRLHRPDRPSTVAGVVAALLAVQAQDIAAAPLALRARSRRLTASDVASAREDRSIVRAWGPRGTLHLIANSDVDWLVPLVNAGTAGSLRRLAQEGVVGEPDELVRVTERSLRGAGPLTKPELADALAKLGREARGQGIVHLAGLAAARGLVVLGPDRAGKPTYVHAEDWLGRRLRPERDRARALAELARRYLRAHGPAAPADLATWSGLPQRDATTAWSAIAPELTEIRHQGRPLWMLKKGAPKPTAVAVALLPAFDEYLLGWHDRGLVVPAEHAKKVQPGGGIIHPVVVAEGVVVGTWRVTRQPGRDAAATTFFEPTAGLDPSARLDEAALQAEAADVARFSSA